MILRILAFPVILFIFLYIVIGRVVPAYRAVQTAQTQKEQKMEELQKTQQKLQKVDVLVRDVQNHPNEQEFLSTYLPVGPKEELITNDMWRIVERAKGEGGTLSMFSIGFTDEDIRSDKEAVHDTNLMQTQVIVNGTYDEFKKLIDHLFRFNRLYAFKTIEITKPEQKKNDQEQGELVDEGTQILSGTITFSYNYIPQQTAMNNMKTFHSVQYDMIEKIESAVSTQDPLVDYPKQRNNPFLP